MRCALGMQVLYACAIQVLGARCWVRLVCKGFELVELLLTYLLGSLLGNILGSLLGSMLGSLLGFMEVVFRPGFLLIFSNN